MTIYLDCNATTPIDPEVMKVVRHYMEVEFGNAGSRTHEYGLRAKQAVERAREQVAAVVNAKPDEVIFTSGATEANNLAILGLEEEGRRSKRMHIISTQIEHKAVLEPLEEMQRRGFEITLVPPTRGGWIDPEDLAARLRRDTLLVSVMHVNNETGVIQPVSRICEVLKGSDAYLHVDAAQGYGKAVGIEPPRVDLISVSAHKVYGPKGVGCLIARRRGWQPPPLAPLLYGGGQERGLRPGTLPVHLVAGFGCAAALAIRERGNRLQACSWVRSVILRQLSGTFEVIGDPDNLVPWTLCLVAQGIDSEALMLLCKGKGAISNGSACTSALYKPSHVLVAMGVEPQKASGAIRISWYHGTAADPKSLSDFLAMLRTAVAPGNARLG